MNGFNQQPNQQFYANPQNQQQQLQPQYQAAPAPVAGPDQLTLAAPHRVDVETGGQRFDPIINTMVPITGLGAIPYEIWKSETAPIKVLRNLFFGVLVLLGLLFAMLALVGTESYPARVAELVIAAIIFMASVFALFRWALTAWLTGGIHFGVASYELDAIFDKKPKIVVLFAILVVFVMSAVMIGIMYPGLGSASKQDHTWFIVPAIVASFLSLLYFSAMWSYAATADKSSFIASNRTSQLANAQFVPRSVWF